MKGLKISPPQSVARIDHTSFLCERSFRILLPTYPPSALSYRPPPSVPPRPCHPPLVRPPTFPSAAFLSFSELLSPSSIYPFEHLGRFATCHSSSNPSAALVRACFLVGLPTALERRSIYEILAKTLLSGSKRTTDMYADMLECANVSGPLYGRRRSVDTAWPRAHTERKDRGREGSR